MFTFSKIEVIFLSQFGSIFNLAEKQLTLLFLRPTNCRATATKHRINEKTNLQWKLIWTSNLIFGWIASFPFFFFFCYIPLAKSHIIYCDLVAGVQHLIFTRWCVRFCIGYRASETHWQTYVQYNIDSLAHHYIFISL